MDEKDKNSKDLFNEFVDSKRNPSLKFEIREFALNWITSSTAHALPNIFRTNQIYLKIIWALFFLTSTGICAYLVVTYIISFLSYGTNVNVAIVNDIPAEFPAITFCNLNPFYKQRSEGYIRTVLQKSNLSALMNITSLGNSTAFALLSATFSTIKAYIATDQSTNSTMRKSYGWDIKEMLMSCYYNDDVCTSDDFTWTQSYEYGNCYTFNGNSSNIKKISNSGPGSGLHLELFVGDGAFDAEYIYPTGAFIIIQNQLVTPLIGHEGFSVATGFETQIAVKRVFSKKLNTPNSYCVEDNSLESSYSSDLYKAIFNVLNHKSYRQKFCFKLCYQKDVIDQCNCSDASYPNPFPNKNGIQISACFSTEQLACVTSVKKQFENRKINDKCLNNCPLECSSISYTYSNSMATYPTAFYVNWLKLQSNLVQRFQSKANINQDKFKESVVKVNIFYDELTYNSIEETLAITWDSLLGNIGGQLGLFLGISILSLVELVELVCELVRISWLYRRQKIKINDKKSRKAW